MSKNVAYTADFDIRADFTVPLFMSSDPDIKFGDTATMSLANMMGECLKGMYESVTVEAGSASIYLYDAGCCSPVQMLRRKKIGLEYLYSVTFSVTLPVHGAEISVFDRIDTNDEVNLIDPTCKPMITVESLTESLTKYTSECSECGAIFGDFPTREQAETTHPTYCPCCGARVISIDSGKE